MRVQDIMSTPVRAVRPQESAIHALALMKSSSVHDLVVQDGRSVIGVVSSRDLIVATAAPENRGLSVGELMSDDLVTATATMTVRQAANRMRGHNIGSLPVLDRGNLVGIVTMSDLLDLVDRGPEPRTAKSRGSHP